MREREGQPGLRDRQVTDATAAAASGLRPPSSFLEVSDLRVAFPTADGVVKAVDGLSFRLDRGRTIGISCVPPTRSSRGMEPSRPKVYGCSGRRKMSSVRPYSAPRPAYMTQIIEAYRIHNDVTRSVARKHAIEMLRRVGIPQPASRVDDYPHQFSGGMRQRAMIAMALSCDPDLLIADEPTTALDVTVQAQILDLIRDLQSEFNSAVIIITHDLGVVAELADDILVMYAGRGAEYGRTEDIFRRPEHPYTFGLLGSMPRLDRVGGTQLIPIRCRYAERNDGASERDVPQMLEAEPGHQVACHLPRQVRRQIWDTEIAPML